MATSKRIFVAICKWNDKLSEQEWTPLYTPIQNGGNLINCDAYGREFGETYFQCPRTPQKQMIIDDVRYYCFNDNGEKTLVYKEVKNDI